jgi:hypothetical protein
LNRSSVVFPVVFLSGDQPLCDDALFDGATNVQGFENEGASDLGRGALQAEISMEAP